MPDSPDLDLVYLFWSSACEQTGSRDFTFVGAVEVLSVRLRLLYIGLNALYKWSIVFGLFTSGSQSKFFRGA